MSNSYSSVILQSLRACWLGSNRNKRYSSNLQSFRSGEEGHVQRIIIQRVNQCSFFNDQIVQACFFRFYTAGKSYGSAANNKNIQYFIHLMYPVLSLTVKVNVCSFSLV